MKRNSILTIAVVGVLLAGGGYLVRSGAVESIGSLSGGGSNEDYPIAVASNGPLGWPMWGFIDKRGKVLVKPQYSIHHYGHEDGEYFLTDRRRKLIPVRTDGKWGYIRPNGRFAIAPKFEDAGPFDDATGLAVAWMDGRAGYINTEGEFVIAPQFYAASTFDPAGGIAFVKVSLMPIRWGIIDKSGRFVVRPQLDGIQGEHILPPSQAPIIASNGLYAVSTPEGWGFVDATGKYAVPPKYERVGEFDDVTGLAPVISRLKIGYVNKQGAEVIPPQFRTDRGVDAYLAEFSPDAGLAMAVILTKDSYGNSTVGGLGFIDMTGRQKFAAIFDDAQPFSGKPARAAVRIGKKWGYIDAAGNIIIKPQFDRAVSFDRDSGLAPVLFDGRWGLIDSTGRVIADSQFDGILGYCRLVGLYPVEFGGKWGLIDKTGKTVVPPNTAVSAAPKRKGAFVTDL